jgi:FKBP-type peptidyl-prolyl cis-trans isomerase
MLFPKGVHCFGRWTPINFVDFLRYDDQPRRAFNKERSVIKDSFMKLKYLVLVSAVAVALTACNEEEQAGQIESTSVEQAAGQTGVAEVALDTQLKKFSYVVGVDMGGQFRTSDIDIDRAAFTAGLSDSLEGKKPRISPEELEEVVQGFHAQQQEKIKKHEEEQRSVAEKNIEEGTAFLAENGAKDGVVTTESGLQYKVIKAGTGASPTADSRVAVHYRGTLIDGREFDASSKHGGAVELNVSEVIPGWTEALQKMKEGAKWELYLPSELAYGPQGAGGIIGPSATLIFEVELVQVLDAE